MSEVSQVFRNFCQKLDRFSQLLEGSDTLLGQVVDIGSADAAADFWKGERESETDKKFGRTT